MCAGQTRIYKVTKGTRKIYGGASKSAVPKMDRKIKLAPRGEYIATLVAASRSAMLER